jgi:hypothetical protein
MINVTKKQRLARRAIAFTLFGLIAMVYGVLELYLPSAASVDSTIVPFARSNRAAVAVASTKTEGSEHAASKRPVNDPR